MNNLKLRAKFVSESYRLNNYEETKKKIDEIFKHGAADALSDAVLNSGSATINSLSYEEKKKVFVDYYKKIGASKVSVSEDNDVTIFTIEISLPELKLKDIKVNVLTRLNSLKNSQTVERESTRDANAESSNNLVMEGNGQDSA